MKNISGKVLLLTLSTSLILSLSATVLSAPSDKNKKGVGDNNDEKVILQKNGVPSFVKGDLGKYDKKNSAVSVEEFARKNSALLKIGNRGYFKQSSIMTDELNQQHIRLKQFIDDKEVINSQIILHVNEQGDIKSFDGNTISAINIAKNPQVSSMSALEKVAYNDLNISTFDIIKTPVLAYAIGFNGQEHLVWNAMIRYLDTDGQEQLDQIVIDAISGVLIYREPDIKHSRNRIVRNGSLSGAVLISEGGSTADTIANNLYNYSGDAWEYFYYKHNRDSYDGLGRQIKSAVHVGSNYNNAYWSSVNDGFFYGDGDGVRFSPLGNALDVVAHEFTHAVTYKTANLAYNRESGALNESFSDVFGASTEVRERGLSSNTWKIGEDVYTPGVAGDALRYMNNPTLDGYSTDYYPERLYPGLCTPSNANDQCGVHGNSGISNLAYYLLVNGGTHPRNKTSVFVSAIGIAKAERIFYRALATKMVSTDNFLAARNKTALSAKELYGNGSVEHRSVCKAWDAVGAPGANQSECNIITGPPATPAGFKARVYGGGAALLYWLPPSGASSIQVYYRASSSTGSFSRYKTISGTARVTDVYVSGNTYFKVRACNSFGCSGFTNSVLAWYKPCGGQGEPACE